MSNYLEALFIPVIGSLLVIGITWLLSPAVLAAVSNDLEWDEITLSELESSEVQPLLSIVIPAYDEEKRITAMINEAHDFLSCPGGRAALKQLQLCSKHLYSQPAEGVQWIIVNDGSKDDTCGVVKSTYRSLNSKDQWHLVSLKENSGKGAAVKTGMIRAAGLFRLMVDADGATEFGPGFQRMVDELEVLLAQTRDSKSDMVAIFGSRAHLQKEAENQRSFLRSFLMYAFHFFVSLLVSSRIQDTQCGFKFFTKSSALLAFKTLHLHRWAFDIEVRLTQIDRVRSKYFLTPTSIAGSHFRYRGD
jgi:dolichyl-phosphate beta-glucosyltransferase